MSTLCAWVRIDAPSGPTALFSVVDGNAAGLQLQLHRVGGSTVRAELLVFDSTRRGSASSMAARPPVPPMPGAALAATTPPLRCGRVVVSADGAARVAWT